MNNFELSAIERSEQQGEAQITSLDDVCGDLRELEDAICESDCGGVEEDE